MAWINSLISRHGRFVRENGFTQIKVNADCFPLCQQSYLGASNLSKTVLSKVTPAFKLHGLHLYQLSLAKWRSFLSL